MGFAVWFLSVSKEESENLMECPEDIRVITYDDYEGVKNSHELMYPSELSLLLGADFDDEEFIPSNINNSDFDCTFLWDSGELIEDVEDFDATVIFFYDSQVANTSDWLNAISKEDFKKRFESDIHTNDEFYNAERDFEEVWNDFVKLRSFFNTEAEKGHAIVMMSSC